MLSAQDKPKIEQRAQGAVVALARDYTMETRGQIAQQWQEYFSRDHGVDTMADAAMYGVSFSADNQGAFRYGIGVLADPVPERLPEGTCTIILSAGDYAVLHAFGPLSELPAKFDAIFSTWLPVSDYVQREGAVFERYPEDPRNEPGRVAYEIWVPVTAKA